MLGRPRSASLNISTQFQAGGQTGTRDQYAALEEEADAETKEDLQKMQQDPEKYVDFKIPWRLGLSYNWSYSSPTPAASSSTQVLSFIGNLSITKKWKLSFQSGYDLASATRIGAHRDLHCWVMDFGWRPLGEQQYYEFSVGVKAPILRYLEYRRDRSYRNQ